MENKERSLTPEAKKKIIFSLLGIVVIAALVFLFLNMKKNPATQNEGPQSNEQGQPGEQTPTENEGNQNTDASIDITSDDLEEVKIENIGEVKVVIPGANPINKDNKVITQEGAVAESSAIPMSAEAPKQTGFLVREELPDNVVQLEISSGKFSPAQFTTKVNTPTTFSLSSVDNFVHVINFDDPAVAAVSILVGPGQTRAITFNAPEKAGEYVFRCNVPGHSDEGEVGKMIVQ